MICEPCSTCEGKWHHFIEGVDEVNDFAIQECKHCKKVIVVPDQTTYLESDDDQHHFFFICEACDCAGMLSLEIDRISQRVHCPENCGAVYVLWRNSLNDNQPDLKCVIRPMQAVYDEPAYGE